MATKKPKMPVFVEKEKIIPSVGDAQDDSVRIARYIQFIFNAVSSAIFIIFVNEVSLASGESSSPVTRLSDIEHMARAFFPVLAAVRYRPAASISTARAPRSAILKALSALS